MFYHETSLVRHLEFDHFIAMTSSQFQFDSYGSFLSWKESEESDKFTYFSKHCGGCTVKNMRYDYYVCQHDGSAAPHCAVGKPGRKTARRNKKGRIKVGEQCPARLLVKQNLATQSVSVWYIAEHRHKLSFTDTKHQPLSTSTRNLVKQRLSLGLNAKQVHGSLVEGVGLRETRNTPLSLKREHFVPLRNIKEMQRKMKVNRRLHSDDATSLMLLVEKLQCEEYDPVLLYKPQGGQIVVGDPDLASLDNFDDLFILGIQTREQRDYLKMGAKTILCVDATHCTNQYGFQLLNLVVPDEFGKGYPVAHFVANRLDEAVLHFFFAAIAARCPDLVINAVMSDDDNAPWNAIVSVFGETPKHLLCLWHILRAWSRKLRQFVSDRSLYDEMYTAVRVILYTRDQSEFLRLTSGFCEHYVCFAPAFVDYFC